MAKYEASLFGRVKGKVGTVVGQYWKGIKYIKEFTTPTDRRSQAQLTVRKAWALTAVLHTAYRDTWSKQPKSGMSYFPIFGLSYPDFQREVLRISRCNINNFPEIYFGHTAEARDPQYWGGSVVEVADGVYITFNVTTGDVSTSTPDYVPGSLRAAVLWYNYTTKEIQILSAQNNRQIWMDEETTDGQYMFTAHLNYTPSQQYLYFAFVQADVKLNGVQSTKHYWTAGIPQVT